MLARPLARCPKTQLAPARRDSSGFRRHGAAAMARLLLIVCLLAAAGARGAAGRQPAGAQLFFEPRDEVWGSLARLKTQRRNLVVALVGERWQPGRWVPAAADGAVTRRSPGTRRANRQVRRRALCSPTHPSRWGVDSNRSNYDVFAIYYEQRGRLRCPGCAHVLHLPGAKWQSVYALTRSPLWEDIRRRYAYVWFPDEDLELGVCSINAGETQGRAS